ncbi:MAG TPA: plastocyanin/azurin family copper-binding protein [Dehalococcoidia bacterium]|nr:plastocyanin/azurin family copper-binding protein [Dehalococcoidia bacterium]
MLKKYLLIMLTSMALLVAACGDEGDGGADEDADHEHSTEVTELTLVSSDTLVFQPNNLEVSHGEPVELILDNTSGSTLHDFTIRVMPVKDVHSEGADHDMGGVEDDDEHEMDSELAVHLAADAGGTGIVRFTPTEPGTYEFVCTVEGHEAAGMVGTIVVK